MMIDTHTHIYAEEFNDDAAGMVARAREAGVAKALLPNVDGESVGLLHAFVESFPDFAYPMMGLHPTSVELDWERQLAAIKPLFAERSYVGVGEIGLDFYWSKERVAEQKAALEEQLRWAVEYGLPVSIHSREAVREVVASIKVVGEDSLRGVFHSFGGNADELMEVIDLKSFMIGVNGVVTFKNSGLADVLKSAVDLSRIILETDAPYLSPVPYRGKRNEPAYIPYIVTKLSEVYDVSPEEVAAITTRNAQTLFNI